MIVSDQTMQNTSEFTSGNDLPVWLIAVGDELLEGRQADTNSRDVQRALGLHKVAVRGVRVVPDHTAEIADALCSTGAGGLVFVFGGLGSTADDLTRDAVAAWADVELVSDPELLSRLEKRWRAMGISDCSGAVRQSQKPAGMISLKNPVGSAPALIGRLQDRMLVLLPGVPPELQALLPVVLEYLETVDCLPRRCPSLLLRTAQIGELALERVCRPVQQTYPELVWSWWLSAWGVDVRVGLPDGQSEADLTDAGSQLEHDLGRLVYAREAVDLPEVIQSHLLKRGLTVSVAESCTAGMLGASLTSTDGSSGFFRGGFLAYANEVKHKQLGVPAELLEAYGAVSQEVAEAMASGCRDRLDTDFSLAITGISGPGGGTIDKPVGTTWIAATTPSTVYSVCYRFPGDRATNRRLTVAAALDTLRRLAEEPSLVPPWLPSDSWRKQG